MPASTDRLGIQLERLGRTADRLETLHAQGSLARRDLDAVYEGIYIRALTVFESFIEDLFFDIMLGRVTYPSRRDVVPRISVRNEAILYGIVKPGRAHLDWLPYGSTRERARLYLRGGRPFCEVDGGADQTIYKWTVVRNRIAHDSREAQAKFEQHILAQYALPPRSRNPVGFLRQQVQVNPNATRFDVILQEMAAIAASMAP